MPDLTQKLGQRGAEAPTQRLRRITDPSDTIISIAALPAVPAPQTRRPGGDRDTRRDAATSVPQHPAHLTRRGEFAGLVLFGLITCLFGLFLPHIYAALLVFLPAWLG